MSSVAGQPVSQEDVDACREDGAVALRLLGDAAVFRERSGLTSPPFRGLTLLDGDPLDAPEFSLLSCG